MVVVVQELGREHVVMLNKYNTMDHHVRIHPPPLVGACRHACMAALRGAELLLAGWLAG